MFERIIELHHANKCNYNGKCSYPNCDIFKPLWNHIIVCMDLECKYPHCKSSRYVLNHYSN